MEAVREIWDHMKSHIEYPKERHSVNFKKMIAKFKHINYKPTITKEEIKKKHPVSFIKKNITAVGQKEEPY